MLGPRRQADLAGHRTVVSTTSDSAADAEGQHDLGDVQTVVSADVPLDKDACAGAG